MPLDLLNIGIEHHRGGRLAEAEAAYTALLDRAPGNPDAMHWMGVLLLQAGQNRRAASLLEQAAAMRPANASYAHNAARGQMAVADIDGAIRSFNRAASLEPDGHESLTGLATALLARNKPGDASAARDALRRAIANGADSADVHHAMAVALLHCGEFDASAAASRKAIERRGDFAEAHCQLALALRNRGDLLGARQSLADALRLDPQCARAFHGLAAMEAEAGELEKSEMLFRQAVALRPDYASAYQGLGRVLQQAGKQAEAMAAMATSVKRSRHTVGRANHSIDAARHPDSTASSVADLQRRLTLSKDGAAMHFSLATQAKLAPPSQVPSVAVVDLFNRYADRFDEHLREQLQYHVPEMIAQALSEMVPSETGSGGAPKLDILDLGCGTGLCGMMLAPIAKSLRGVDLSPLMIEKAKARHLYNDLSVGDLVEAMRDQFRCADLIVCADVFVYVGDLAPTMEAASKTLRSGGMLIFSVEAGGGDRYHLLPNGRYQHSLSYLEHLGRIFGFSKRRCDNIVVRMDNGAPIHGFLMFLVNA